MRKGSLLAVHFDQIAEDVFSAEILNKLNEIVLKIVRAEKLPQELNAVFTNNSRIKTINQRYRGIKKPTDVLSFNYQEKGLIDFKDPSEETGEIFISVEYLKEYSRVKGISFDYLVFSSLTHGLFHLAGYDHGDDITEREMREKEDGILKCVGVG